MEQKSTRRSFLKKIAASSIVVGFNLQSQSWANESELQHLPSNVFTDDFPVFEGGTHN